MLVPWWTRKGKDYRACPRRIGLHLCGPASGQSSMSNKMQRGITLGRQLAPVAGEIRTRDTHNRHRGSHLAKPYRCKRLRRLKRGSAAVRSNNRSANRCSFRHVVAVIGSQVEHGIGVAKRREWTGDAIVVSICSRNRPDGRSAKRSSRCFRRVTTVALHQRCPWGRHRCGWHVGLTLPRLPAARQPTNTPDALTKHVVLNVITRGSIATYISTCAANMAPWNQPVSNHIGKW